MELTRVPPFTTIHGIKERRSGSALYGVLETWCGKHPDPSALPTLNGTLDDINCTTCRRTKHYKAVSREIQPL